MTEDELLDQLKMEVKGLTAYLTDPTDYENAIADAIRETGWAMPVSTGFRELWIKNRAKRHLFFYLYSESAHKFKYEQINLQQRFEHYGKIIAVMDVQFEGAIEGNPAEFANVSAVQMFGTKIDAGFQTDPFGRDTTYTELNTTIVTPGDSEI